MRYFHIFSAFIALSLKEALEYPIDLLFGFVNSFISIGVSIVVLFAMFQHNSQMAGWSIGQVIVVVGFFRMIKGLVDTFISPNLKNIQQLIRNGGFDYILLKPVDAQFYTSFRSVEIWNILSVLVALCTIIFGIFTLNEPPAIVSSLLFILAIPVATLVIYSIWSIIMSTTFWLIDTSNLYSIVTSGMNFAQFPIQIYPRALQFFFTFIFPIVFVSTVPATILFSDSWFGFPVLLAGLVAAFILLGISRKIWMTAIASYTSVA